MKRKNLKHAVLKKKSEEIRNGFSKWGTLDPKIFLSRLYFDKLIWIYKLEIPFRALR